MRVPLVACLLATATVLASEPLHAEDRRAPGPAADFPSLDSYYPPAAARAGQQGTVTVHVCVDVHGNLTEPPTVAGSSGNYELDTGGINLANAGNGHYRPATVDGVPVQGCGAFRVAFKMRGSAGLPINDPRFPTIGARIGKLNDEMTRRLKGRSSAFADLRYIGAALDTGDPAAERSIRNYARSCDSFIDETVGLAADFLDDIDYLQDSPDIPEAEREIFKQEWPKNRSALVVDVREMVASLRDLVRVADELGDYVAFSVARRTPREGKQALVPSVDPQLDALRQRANAVLQRLQTIMKANGAGSPADSKEP